MFSERNLLAAFQQVAKNDGAPGVDHVTVDEFERRLPDSIWELSDLIKSGTFQPQAIKRVEIPKPGSNEMRPLARDKLWGPTVRDRVVQAAIVNVIEPIFERALKTNTVLSTAMGFDRDAAAKMDCVESMS